MIKILVCVLLLMTGCSVHMSDDEALKKIAFCKSVGYGYTTYITGFDWKLSDIECDFDKPIVDKQ